MVKNRSFFPVSEPFELVFRYQEQPDLISIILPCFNSVDFLSDTLDSVWRQTVPPADIEIVAIDDGSTDGSYERLLELQSASPIAMQVLTHPHRTNQGVCASRNLGLEHARGAWIALLDADDRFHPRRLEAFRLYLKQHPEAETVCSYGRNINPAGEVIQGYNGLYRAGEYQTLYPSLRPPFTFNQLIQHYPIVNSSLTIRRAALGQVHGYPPTMAFCGEDQILLLKLSLAHPIHQIEEELVDYMHHDRSATARLIKNDWGQAAHQQIRAHLIHWMKGQTPYRDRATELHRQFFSAV